MTDIGKGPTGSTKYFIITDNQIKIVRKISSSSVSNRLFTAALKSPAMTILLESFSLERERDWKRDRKRERESVWVGGRMAQLLARGA